MKIKHWLKYLIAIFVEKDEDRYTLSGTQFWREWMIGIINHLGAELKQCISVALCTATYVLVLRDTVPEKIAFAIYLSMLANRLPHIPTMIRELFKKNKEQ